MAGGVWGDFITIICTGKQHAAPDPDEDMYDFAVLEFGSTGRI